MLRELPPDEFSVPKRGAVFLDRDGVINVEAGYITSLADLVLIPGAAQAIALLNRREIFCCLVSNQAGAARGYYPLSHIDALHQRLQELLRQEADAFLNHIYYCPSLSPAEGGVVPELTYYSTWRKPNTGMLVAAAWEHNLDLTRSVVIGDKATDIDMAHNAGCKGILVTTGYGKAVLAGTYQHPVQPDYIATDLLDAVRWVIKNWQF